MMNTQEALKPLERAGMLRFLYLLGEKGESNVTEMNRSLGGSLRTVYNCIKAGEKTGLVTNVKQDEFPFTVTIKLTNRGRHFYEALRKITEQGHNHV